VGDALATAEQLGRLSDYIDRLLTGMARELRAGSIAADPWYKSDNENTCLYCDYYSACHFDESCDKWRWPAALKAPEFWARLEGGAAEGGEGA
jgi:ATP-dependent helicase/nuclease subunit B